MACNPDFVQFIIDQCSDAKGEEESTFSLSDLTGAGQCKDMLKVGKAKYINQLHVFKMLHIFATNICEYEYR